MMSDVYLDNTISTVSSSDNFNTTCATVAPTINFNLGGEAVLVIDEKGLTYRGELAEDAGECYSMLTEFLNRAKREKL
tara:strand:+ start:343 stop:576 length:234 start_codon:yes stop_codon:yes gene_type:complete